MPDPVLIQPAPFVWFGGKSRAASLIWDRLGDVQSYVEPFAGSLAVLLGRPHEPSIETINDLDGFVCNLWRALAADPEAVACHADWPVSEIDLIARHLWLVGQRADLTLRLQGDPDYYDAKIAGWWVWGINCWIGSGWCSGRGPWVVQDGLLVDSRVAGRDGNAGQGVNRQRPHLGGAGRGVNRQRPHLGSADQGVNRQLPHLGDHGRGVNRPGEDLIPWFTALAARLRRVRVCCGDWTRVMGDSVLWPTGGVCGVVLDPPYSGDERQEDLYALDSGTVAADVRGWAIANGDRPDLRIALCGYDTEHAMPDSWTRESWTAAGGYSNRGDDNKNKYRETVWFNRACIGPRQPGLFG